MNELYNKLKKYSINDAIKIEETDRQFIALKNLFENIENKEIYLSLIISNAIICYQLSGKGEDYWEEFSSYFSNIYIKNNNLLDELGNFIKQSKNNKRFIDIKIKRLEKLKPFLEIFIGNEEKFYNDMEKLRDSLAKTMKQKKDAKTIVFAVKMFSYGARNIYNKINYFPVNINVPVDSRLIALFEKYKGDYDNIDKFYFDLSKKLDIPELHLDALLWVNYNELIKQTMNLKNYINEIKDFPKAGINFKDMSPILEESKALEFVINSFEIQNMGITKIVGLDARGFIFGSILAYKMKIPFIMLRKVGKLPGKCESISYDLEYGSNTFEIQKNAIKSGDKVAIVDDLLATGGSAKAAIDLVEKLGGIIESVNFVIELRFLNGREKFSDKKIVSLVKY